VGHSPALAGPERVPSVNGDLSGSLGSYIVPIAPSGGEEPGRTHRPDKASLGFPGSAGPPSRPIATTETGPEPGGITTSSGGGLLLGNTERRTVLRRRTSGNPANFCPSWSLRSKAHGPTIGGAVELTSTAGGGTVWNRGQAE